MARLREKFGQDPEISIDSWRVGAPPREWLVHVAILWADGLVVDCGIIEWAPEVMILDPIGEHYDVESALRYIQLRRQNVPRKQAERLA